VVVVAVLVIRPLEEHSRRERVQEEVEVVVAVVMVTAHGLC
jgi:hypothetical protein